MARRTGGPAITLFSFQDIITSVSGIMIFITLMLALELVEKAQKGGAEAAAISDATDLKARIASARAERDVLRKQAISATRSAARSTLAATRAAQEAEDRVEQAVRDLEVLEKRAARARNREVEAKTRKVGVEVATEEEYNRKMAALDELRRKYENARIGNRVYFNVETASSIGRDGWMALLDGRTITVAPLSRSRRPRLFLGPPNESGELDPASLAFIDWANKEVRGSYVLLVARPSGLGRIASIEEAFIRSNRQYGLDVVTESQEVIDPENGVYRP